MTNEHTNQTVNSQKYGSLNTNLILNLIDLSKRVSYNMLRDRDKAQVHSRLDSIILYRLSAHDRVTLEGESQITLRRNG